MTEYKECDQCMRRCPVDHLRCDNGKKRYLEVTGKKYRAAADGETEPKATDDGGAAYRRKIRERRARRQNQNAK